MDFLYVKALHIIFVVTWFAGLFYIVRLFIYQTEAEQKPSRYVHRSPGLDCDTGKAQRKLGLNFDKLIE